MKSFAKKTFGIITAKDLKRPGPATIYTLLLVFGFIVTLVAILPPVWILLSSMKDIKELFAIPPTIIPLTFYPEKLVEAWELLDFGIYYLNSLIMVVGAIVCSVFFNGLLAYAISKLRPRGGKVVYYLVMWSLMIPNTISLVPLFQNIVEIGQVNSFLPLWLSFGAQAFNVLLYKSFFDDLPDSLLEAAKLDGASDLGIFFRIVIPLSVPIIIVICIFTFNAAWSEFLLSYLVLKSEGMHTVMIKLYRMSEVWGFSMDLRLVAMTFSMIPPVIMFIIFQRQITQGMALSGIKG